MDNMTLILFVAGIALLIFGADLLVRGASRLALSMGISPLVIGLTVVAYGTSSPELAVSLQSSYIGAADIAVGNVVGSNIANVLLILGIAALIMPLIVAQQLTRLDTPLMVGLSILLLLMGLDGVIGRWDGLILSTGAVAYTIFVIRQSRKEKTALQQEHAQQLGHHQLKTRTGQVMIQLGLIIIGLALLVLGSDWLIDGAVALARVIGVTELIIGLTVVAVGTSLPEVATSVVASIRGERDIAVGNIIGSNIFNILFVLGLSAFVAPAGIDVSASALRFDIPVMIAVAVVCLPIFFTNSLISRWEGALFLGYYLIYTLYLFLNATQHQTLVAFNTAMIVFVIPLTIIALVLSVIHSLKVKRRERAASGQLRS